MTSEFDKRLFYASLHSAAINVLEERLGRKPDIEEIAYAINDEMDAIQIGEIHHLAILKRAVVLRQVLGKSRSEPLVKREDQKAVTLFKKQLKRIGLTI